VSERERERERGRGGGVREDVKRRCLQQGDDQSRDGVYGKKVGKKKRRTASSYTCMYDLGMMVPLETDPLSRAAAAVVEVVVRT
jgi:hypothetical protein